MIQEAAYDHCYRWDGETDHVKQHCVVRDVLAELHRAMSAPEVGALEAGVLSLVMVDCVCEGSLLRAEHPAVGREE